MDEPTRFVRGDFVKSLNVKKIASAAAGGALLAAAFVGAVTVDESSLGNYNFFTNGEPNVKIVVGSQAQIWDGVAAANIAAMVGNLAYSERDVTQTGGATATPAASPNPSALPAGTVADKNVELSVTTPAGATGQTGTANIDTQLYDFLDNSIKTATTGRTDDSDGIGDPGLIGDGITTGGFYLSNQLFPDVVFKGAVANLGSYSVSQEEGYYVSGQSYYDFTEDAYVADRIRMAYVTNFTDAIPYHVDIVNGSTAGRASNDNQVTENRNIKLKFLGRDYVITDFENGSATMPTVSLGESAVFKQIKTGESIKLGVKEIRLVSISPIATGSTQQPFASFEIVDAEGTRLDFFSMSKDSSDYNKNGIILDVRDVFVGGGESSYTEVAVYSSAITIKDGDKLVFQGDDATTRLNQDAGWGAALVFNTRTIGTDHQKALKSIRITGPTSARVKVGKSFDLIAKPVAKSVTFLGPVAADRDTLSVSALGRRTMDRMSPVGDNATADVFPNGVNVDVNVTELRSSYISAFLVGGKSYDTVWIDKYNGRFIVRDTTSSPTNYTSPSDIADDTLDYYYPGTPAIGGITLVSNNAKPGPAGLAGAITGGSAFNFTGNTAFMVAYNMTSTGGISRPSVVSVVASGAAPATTGAFLNWHPVTGAHTYLVYAYNGTGFQHIGNTSSTSFNTSLSGSALTAFAAVTGAPNATTKDIKLRILEPIVDNLASFNGWFNIDMFPGATANDASYLFNSTLSTTTLTTQYATTVTPGTSPSFFPATGGSGVEQGFVSPGGSILKSLGLSSITIEYPKRLVKARFQFGAPSNVNITAAGEVVSTTTLNEGEEYSLGGGYKVKVSAIGGTAVCTGGGSTGAGTCSPNKAAVVTPLNTASDRLVVLDSDAGSTAQVIVVGGPMVNSIAAGTPGVAEATNAPGSSIVRVIGGKVFVAGYTAQDTQDAANALIGWLATNRDTVRGV